MPQPLQTAFTSALMTMATCAYAEDRTEKLGRAVWEIFESGRGPARSLDRTKKAVSNARRLGFSDARVPFASGLVDLDRGRRTGAIKAFDEALSKKHCDMRPAILRTRLWALTASGKTKQATQAARELGTDLANRSSQKLTVDKAIHVAAEVRWFSEYLAAACATCSQRSAADFDALEAELEPRLNRGAFSHCLLYTSDAADELLV